MTPDNYRAFLESLKVSKFEGEEMKGFYPGEKFNLSMPLDEFEKMALDAPCASWCHIAYLLERCRRAEANAKPPTLLEDVKEAIRSAMIAQRKFDEGAVHRKPWIPLVEFRQLSEADK